MRLDSINLLFTHMLQIIRAYIYWFPTPIYSSPVLLLLLSLHRAALALSRYRRNLQNLVLLALTHACKHLTPDFPTLRRIHKP